jgi:FkbM family methyltransferase
MLINFLKALTPPIILQMIKTVVNRAQQAYAPTKQDAQLLSRIEELSQQFRHNNLGVAQDILIFRPGLELGIHPESRFAFEHFCFIDPEMVQEMNCFLETTKNCRQLLDVGALHGIFSLAFTAASREKSAVAVDASPIAFARLLYNIHRNKHCQISPVETAVSDRIGTLQMHYEWEHAVAGGTQGEDAFGITMVTGDQLCESQDIKPDVIKIDVEGHELKVLSGLTETVRNFRPLIFLEVHPSRLTLEGDDLGLLSDFFQDLGYGAKTIYGLEFPLSKFSTLTDDTRLVLFSQ